MCFKDGKFCQVQAARMPAMVASGVTARPEPPVRAAAAGAAAGAVYRDGKGDQDIENGDIWIEVNLPTAHPVLYYQVSIRDDESDDYDQ